MASLPIAGKSVNWLYYDGRGSLHRSVLAPETRHASLAFGLTSPMSPYLWRKLAITAGIAGIEYNLAGERMTNVVEVFGINNTTNPLSYIERQIDQKFKDALLANEHSVIMIYGTSKQGKSSLRRNVLPDAFCTFVPASSGMTTSGLYREVLNQARVAGPITSEVEWKAAGEGNAELGVPAWLANLIKLSAKMQLEKASKSQHAEVEVDYEVAGSVARKYRDEVGCKPIVIDNFHYFSPETQGRIATDIRAFEEKGIKVVIMGTWKARDYLVRANPDLTGRVCALSIEPWSDEDFGRVIDTGEAELNVKFTPGVREVLISKAAGNIGLLQKGLRECLKKLNINQTCSAPVMVSDARVVREVYREIAGELVSDMTSQLKRITEIGERWHQWKTRTHFIIKAFVGDQESNKVEGVSLQRLMDRTNDLVRRETSGTLQLSHQALSTLVTRDLLAGQQRLIRTPMLAYDHFEERLVPLDSWLLFTLRHHRPEILGALE